MLRSSYVQTLESGFFKQQKLLLEAKAQVVRNISHSTHSVTLYCGAQLHSTSRVGVVVL